MKDGANYARSVLGRRKERAEKKWQKNGRGIGSNEFSVWRTIGSTTPLSMPNWSASEWMSHGFGEIMSGGRGKCKVDSNGMRLAVTIAPERENGEVS